MSERQRGWSTSSREAAAADDRAERRPSIGWLLFEATGACNLRCRYCYNVWHAPAHAQPAPRGSYRAACRTLGRMFREAEVRRVILTGGEPLLAQRVLELVLFLRLRGKAVSLITNGNAGEAGTYGRLVDLGVSVFELPFHSPGPDEHDTMTGVPGSWARAAGSLAQLRSLGVRPVAVIVVTRLNAHLVGATIEALERRGVERVMLARFNVGGRGIRERALLEPSLDELRAAFSAAERVARAGTAAVSANVCTPLCALAPEEFPHVAWSNCSADVSRRPLTLDVSGNVRFCNHSPVVAGNVWSQPLPQILGGAYMQSWAASRPAVCAGCTQWTRCLGGCRAAAEQLGGMLACGDPLIVDAGGKRRAGRPLNAARTEEDSAGAGRQGLL